MPLFTRKCPIQPRPLAPHGVIAIRRTYDKTDESSFEGGENEGDYSESGWYTTDDQEWTLDPDSGADLNWREGRERSTMRFRRVDAAYEFLRNSGCLFEWSGASGRSEPSTSFRTGESTSIGCHVDVKESDPRLARKLLSIVSHGGAKNLRQRRAGRVRSVQPYTGSIVPSDEAFGSALTTMYGSADKRRGGDMFYVGERVANVIDREGRDWSEGDYELRAEAEMQYRLHHGGHRPSAQEVQEAVDYAYSILKRRHPEQVYGGTGAAPVADVDPDTISVEYQNDAPVSVTVNDKSFGLVESARDGDGVYYVAEGKWRGNPIEVRDLTESYFPDHPSRDYEDPGSPTLEGDVVSHFEPYAWQGTSQVNLKARRHGGGTLEVWVGEN